MKRKCPFCGKSPPEIKFSGEHVLPKWLAKKINTDEKYLNINQWHTLNAVGFPEIQREQRLMSPFDQKVKVCKTCNEGWMEIKVEAPVQGFLDLLALSNPVTIESKMAYQVALWAAKTTCTRALMDKGKRAIPVEHYRFIMEELKPPPNTMVWAIPCLNEATLTRHYRFIIEFSIPPVLGHITTLKFGTLALFVVGFSERLPPQVLKNLDTHIQEQCKNSAVHLWPIATESKWPINERMDESHILQLTETTSDLVIGSLSDPRAPWVDKTNSL